MVFQTFHIINGHARLVLGSVTFAARLWAALGRLFYCFLQWNNTEKQTTASY